MIYSTATVIMFVTHHNGRRKMTTETPPEPPEPTPEPEEEPTHPDTTPDDDDEPATAEA